jgi:endonuclease/exonuclease/phosphatase family metal-dependent hydrolase
MITALVGAFKPDILCLDEVSAGVSDALAAQTFASNYLTGPGLTYDAGAVSPNPGAHLNGATFAKSGSALVKHEVGIPSTDWDTHKTKRDTLRITFQVPQASSAVQVFFVHANASYHGAEAAALACKHVAKNPFSAFMGDFNHPVDQAEGAVPPEVRGLKFTQWKVNLHGTKVVPGPSRNASTRFTPHDRIDYAIPGRGLQLKPVDLLRHLTEDELGELILNFDHFPVAYQFAVRR